MTGNGLRELLKRADDEGFAVPSFNYSDIWDFIAITEAAEEENAPVMIASNPLVVNAISIEMCGAMGRVAMEKSKTPLIHHLDHSYEVGLCVQAVDAGFPSVMIDASNHPLKENARITGEVVAYAGARGVHVEGEIGKIMGRGAEGDYTGGGFLAETDDAVYLVEATGLDSLAVGIGTAHGFYKGKPEINFSRLAEINEAVDTPLVLHGGTGIPEEDVKRAIKLGINKVNVGTIIHCTYMNGMRRELASRPENSYTLDVVKPVLEEIKHVVRGWIKVCMANGKA